MSESTIEFKRRDGKPLGTPVDPTLIEAAMKKAVSENDERRKAANGRCRLNNDLCDGESGSCRAEVVWDAEGDLIDFNPNAIQIDEIALERVGQGFTQMCIAVNVRIGDRWYELIRDRETSSNSHRLTAKQIRDIVEAK